MNSLCNLNGQIVPESEATISVLDRGFLFGDSVYEVFRTFERVPFAWREHLERLRGSAAGIAMTLDLDDPEIMRRVKATIAASDAEECYVRIIATRGTGTAPNIDLSFAAGPPNWVIMVRPLGESTGKPLRLAVVERLRNDERSLDPAIKSGNYLNNVLGLADARAAGADDCLFLNHHEMVTEASTSNFFVVAGGTVKTPPLSAGLLRGTTRRLLFEVAAGAGIPMVEADLAISDLRAADEAFVTSTLRDVTPVVAIDDRPVGNGAAGPMTSLLLERYLEFCRRRCRELDAPAYEQF